MKNCYATSIQKRISFLFIGCVISSFLKVFENKVNRWSNIAPIPKAGLTV
jgi:hypothetical protein